MLSMLRLGQAGPFDDNEMQQVMSQDSGSSSAADASELLIGPSSTYATQQAQQIAAEQFVGPPAPPAGQYVAVPQSVAAAAPAQGTCNTGYARVNGVCVPVGASAPSGYGSSASSFVGPCPAGQVYGPNGCVSGGTAAPGKTAATASSAASSAGGLMQAISALLGIGCPVGQQKDTTVGSPTYNQCVSSAVLAANAQAAMLAKLLGTKAPVVAKKSNNDWLIAGGIGIAVLAVVVLVATRK